MALHARHYRRALGNARVLVNRGRREQAVAIAERAAQLVFGDGVAYEIEKANNFGLFQTAETIRADCEAWNKMIDDLGQDLGVQLSLLTDKQEKSGGCYEQGV